jgi:DUF4097 and DUF4098 domain-containing protein YvlB
MEFIRTLSRDFDVGDRLDLSTDTRSGTVSIRGEETSHVRIEVVARLWADDELEADEQAELIARGIKREGARVVVRAPTLLRPHPLLFFGRSPRIDYQITAPRQTRVEVKSRSGRVEIDAVQGPLNIESHSGKVTLREIGSEVHIISRSGSVQGEAIAGSVEVDSRSGSARLAHCKGNVTVLSRSGSVHLEEAGGDVKIDARSGSVRYDGDVRGSFEIQVESGSMRLSVNPDAVFFLDAESAHGSVRSDLQMKRNSGATPDRSSSPTVRLRTRSGSIYIGPR